MSPASGEKICVICGESCADKPRVKDPKGRYYCRACYDQAQQRRKAKKDESHAASTEHEQAPQPAVDDMPDFSDPPPLADDDRDMRPFDKSLLDDDEIGLEGEGGRGSAGANKCPGCGAVLAADAILCVQCGFNLQTGEAVTPSVEADADDAESSAPDIVATGATRWPAVIGALSMVFGGFFLLSALLNSVFSALAIQNPMEVILIIGGLFLAAAVWLWPVWGGLGLFRRRPGGARLLRIWSIVMIAVFGTLLALFAVSIPFVGGLVTGALSEVGADAEIDLPLGEMAMVLMVVLLAILAVMFLAWPTFLLLWFRRESIKAEVGRWSSSEKD